MKRIGKSVEPGDLKGTYLWKEEINADLTDGKECVVIDIEILVKTGERWVGRIGLEGLVLPVSQFEWLTLQKGEEE